MTFLLGLFIFGMPFVLIRSAEAESAAPTGSLAYVQLTDGYWQVWVANLADNSFRQITHSASDKRYPKWQGKYDRIVYRTAESQIFSVDLVTGREERQYTSLGSMLDARLSPDGSKVVYAKARENVVDDIDLWLLENETSIPQILVSEPGLQYAPAWSPDGNEIVFVSGQGHNTHELVVLNLISKEPKQLTKNNAYDVSPVFSPDGKRILFSSDRSGDYNLWEMNYETGEVEQVTDTPGLETDPTFAPDQEWIAYTRAVKGEMRIALMHRKERTESILSTPAEARDPDWR